MIQIAEIRNRKRNAVEEEEEYSIFESIIRRKSNSWMPKKGKIFHFIPSIILKD